MIEAVVIGEIPLHRSGVVPSIVQVAGHTHSVAARTFEVSQELTVVSLVGRTKAVTCPRIGLVLDNTLVNGATNHAESCEFPFSLSRKAVGRLQDTILATRLARLATGGRVKVGKLVLAALTAELTCKIDICLESGLSA